MFKTVNYADLHKEVQFDQKMDTCAVGAIQYVLSGMARIIFVSTHNKTSAIRLFRF
jgi:hypothetical protein